MSLAGRRIIFFVTSLTAGGAERVLCSTIENSAGELSVRAIICLKWTPDRRLKDKLQKVAPIIELAGNPEAGFVRQTWRALQACWHDRTALFQGWMYHGCVMATLFWWLVGPGNALFWAIHSSGIVGREDRFFRAAEQLGLGIVCRLSGATVIYCGENSQRVHVEQWHWPRKNSKVIKNGINTQRFVPSDEIYQKIRQELRIPEGSLVLGYVGRWHQDKDVGTLCRALASLEPPVSGLVVVFCGNGLDQQNHEFAAAILDASKKVRCICLGEVPDTSRLIPAFDFLCLSSLREAFPLVLCEALACGVPCIATDVGDCRGIINGFGRLVPPGDFPRLAQAIAEYAGVLRNRASVDTRKAAREWAVETLDETKAAQRYIALLDSVCPR